MEKRYAIKEIYYTLQGEGFHTGKAAIFCRFSGCNLWTGREEDRAKAICQFCDTDFWGTDGENGGKYSVTELTEKCQSLWGAISDDELFIVFTGGEPALQLDKDLIEELHSIGFKIAIETNGTLPLPEGIDWVCVSPKANTEIIVNDADELKLVFPQKGISPSDFKNYDTNNFYLQPMDEQSKTEQNIHETIKYCMQNPKWALSLQTHKIVGIR